MTKLYPMKKSPADRRAEEDAMGSTAIGAPQNDEDRDGITVHLDHHHLKNMKVGGGLKHGDRVVLHGEGHVEHADTTSGEHGEKHSARIRITHAGMEHDAKPDAEKEKGDLRNEIEQIHGKSEESREKRVEAKGAARAKTGEKVAEKTGG